MSVLIGSRLGPYEIVSPVGSGGMGQVYRARDERLGRDVAIKVLTEGVFAEPDALRRFEREARAVAALNHPNILAIHDIGNEDGVVYLVTELLEGATLREQLATGALPPRRALDYAIQMARGLGAAHERGIVHRDIKPENLFLTRDGRLKILDFGVAQIERPVVSTGATTEATFAVTQPGMIVGTPGYMSPEQITGEPASPRSDVFAFGLVVYEMLSGTQPFRRRTAAEAFSAVLREDAVPLARVVPAVSPTLGRIVDRCLEKRAADRPGSAADLAMYLEAHAAEIGARGTETHVLPPVPRRQLIRRMLLESTAVLLLVSAATWGLVQVMADRAATAAVDTALSRADGMVQRVHQDRLERLVLTARLVASFPALKALVENTDGPTIRETLVGQQQQIPGAPILVAMSPDGRVLARTDAVAGASPDDREWIAALRTGAEGGLVRIGGRTYHAAAAAAEAAASIFGHIVAALPVDDGFARAITASTQDDTILLADDAVLATTLRAGETPWRSLRQWRSAAGRGDRPATVRIGTQQFAAREIRLATDPAVSAITVKSRDEAIGPYRRIQRGLLVIALLGVVAAVAGGMWIAAAGQRRYAAAG